MAAGQQYKAVFDFDSTGKGILSFKKGDRFTLVSKTNEDWWSVRSASGESGLAPITYLEACPVSATYLVDAVEPPKCGHFGDPERVSRWERCPDFSGGIIQFYCIGTQSVLIKQDVLISGCPKWVLL